MFCIVHADYDVVPQVYHDQMMFFVVYVNYYATSSPRSKDYERHRLVMIDLGDNVVVYVDYAEHRLVVIDV